MEKAIDRLYGLQFNKQPYHVHFTNVIKNINTHWHEYYEMELVIFADKAYTIINGKKIAVQSGSVFFLTPSDFHAWLFEDGGQIRVASLSFTLDAVSSRIGRELLEIGATAALALEDEELMCWTNEFTMLKNEYDKTDEYDEAFAQNILERICLLILQKARKYSKKEKEEILLMPVLEYLKKNFRKKITVDQLATLIHISPKYFPMYFSKNTGGMSMMKYLNKLRVDYAASLLAVSDMSVEQIAFDAGFCSSSYFSRTFKQYYKMSPLEYRKLEYKK